MRRFEKSHGGDGSRKLNKFGSDYQDDYRSKDGLRAEKSDHAQKQRRAEHEKRRGVKTKGVKEAYSVNAAQQAAIAIAKKKKKEDDMVAKKKKEKMYAGYEPQGETIEEADKKGKGSGTKDACYHKVKSRYSVWPSAYASGALVKCLSLIHI